MNELSGSDSRYCVSEAKRMEKCHMMIAGSVNKTFGPWKINAQPVIWDGAHGPIECGWPISHGRSGRYKNST